MGRDERSVDRREGPGVLGSLNPFLETMSWENRLMRTLSVLVFVLACACRPQPVPTPPPTTDGGTAASCAIICDHLRDLGCPTAKPTPEGASCVVVCGNANTADSPVHWDLECRARAASCAAAEACR